MTPIELDVLRYLKSQSSRSDFYYTWLEFNAELFDQKLKPIPILIGLSNYGNAAGFCSMDHIMIQPFCADADWKGTLLHEMCHQADRQERLKYLPVGRVNNIHNSETWCNRINSIMAKLGDNRWATPYTRKRDGSMHPISPCPEGKELIEYAGLKGWEPLSGVTKGQ